MKPNSIKWRIAVRSAALPLLFLSLFILSCIFEDFIFNKGMSIGFLGASLFRLFFNQRRYLLNISSGNGYVNIFYYTPFLQKKLFSREENKITNIDYERFGVSEAFDHLLITDEKEWLTFHLVTKEIREHVKKKIGIYNNFGIAEY